MKLMAGFRVAERGRASAHVVTAQDSELRGRRVNWLRTHGFDWIAMSDAFSHLSNISDHNAIYGVFGAPMGLLMWTWPSVTVGADLNAELEHQTRQDTTTALPCPVGTRGVLSPTRSGKPHDPGGAEHAQFSGPARNKRLLAKFRKTKEIPP